MRNIALNSSVGDAESVKELDIDACYQIDVIQSELLDTMHQKFGWYIDDIYDNYTIKYNDTLILMNILMRYMIEY